jgi:hypothetical protein
MVDPVVEAINKISQQHTAIIDSACFCINTGSNNLLINYPKQETSRGERLLVLEFV